MNNNISQLWIDVDNVTDNCRFHFPHKLGSSASFFYQLIYEFLLFTESFKKKKNKDSGSEILLGFFFLMFFRISLEISS